MKSLAFFSIFILMLIGFSSCTCNKCEDDDLRTTPVTNNPHIVPNTASAFPGIPSTPQPGTL